MSTTPSPRKRTPGGSGRSVGSGSPRMATEAEREQALRDYKVTIEYKHLKQHAPGGVYLVPSLDDLRHFYGVIFVRRGPYTNGVFKFTVTLPGRYNDVNAWPIIKFTSFVYNPHVDPATGELDVKSAYPTWDPHRHYLVTVLTYLKKIFYLKSFEQPQSGKPCANVEALKVAQTDPAKYKKHIAACVTESQKNAYVNEDVDGGECTAKFTEERACHIILRDLMRTRLGRDPSQLTKNKILDMVSEAHKREREGATTATASASSASPSASAS